MAAPTLFERAFWVLLVYYWALQFARGDILQLVSPDLLYYFFVGPAALFVVAGGLYVLATVAKLNTSAVLFGAMFLLILTVFGYRGDYRTIGSVGLLALTLGILFQTRPRLSLNLLNILFVSAVIVTSVMFYYNLSIYSLLPGLNAHPQDWWRISAYPSAAEGGLLAMVVLITNVAARGQPFRYAMIAFAAYMLVFSGSRTGLFAALLCLVYLALRRRQMLSTERGRRTFLVAAIAVFVFTIFASDLLLALPFADTEFFRTLIFRQEALAGGFNTGGQLGTAAVRQWIFEQHLAAFRESPLFGIGTYDLRMLTTGYEALADTGTGSEAFVTGLLARIGLISVLLYVPVFLTNQNLAGFQVDLSACMRICLAVGMITYGSFVNVYDIVFLLLVIGIYGGIRVPATSPSPAVVAPEGGTD